MQNQKVKKIYQVVSVCHTIDNTCYYVNVKNNWDKGQEKNLCTANSQVFTKLLLIWSKIKLNEFFKNVSFSTVPFSNNNNNDNDKVNYK